MNFDRIVFSVYPPGGLELNSKESVLETVKNFENRNSTETSIFLKLWTGIHWLYPLYRFLNIILIEHFTHNVTQKFLLGRKAFKGTRSIDFVQFSRTYQRNEFVCVCVCEETLLEFRFIFSIEIFGLFLSFHLFLKYNSNWFWEFRKKL